jgi:hypothetical protein
MQLYEVNYSVGNSSSTQFLVTVVSAWGLAQARGMVENMNGGAGNCRIHSCYPK